jgi:hypothetical protein
MKKVILVLFVISLAACSSKNECKVSMPQCADSIKVDTLKK